MGTEASGCPRPSQRVPVSLSLSVMFHSDTTVWCWYYSMFDFGFATSTNRESKKPRYTSHNLCDANGSHEKG